ncbi:MAG TPA: hypothetical protein VNU68_36085 [Verrucomicrobiae bacterium]|jgi:hypothetical protein|nr:hypothetical protein [Verrucomicrobiae bacterium]
MTPLNIVLRGGAHYSTYSATHKTDDEFKLPDDFVTTFARVGLRFAGSGSAL